LINHQESLVLSLIKSASDPKIIVAMDFDNAEACVAMAKRLSPHYCRLKVGKELFTAAGPQILEKLMALGFEIFLDLKFHDIPSTTSKAVKVAADLGVWMVNVHALGGERMLTASRDILENKNKRPLLIAVTVLTSMEDKDLQAVGIESSIDTEVNRLASLTVRCGHEAQSMRKQFGKKFCLVTPGIRLESSPADDQRRTLTPVQAIAAGSNYLVIGRPITQAADPALVCHQIFTSLG
jgi:orotidine-5'-phosphate decarboxylase